MINKEYTKLLKESNLCNSPEEEAQGILFGFLIENMYEFGQLENMLFKCGLFPYERFQEYQIQLCKTDLEGKLRLIIPLSGFDVTDEYFELLGLLKELHVGTRGFANNELEYAIFNDIEDKEALKKAKTILGNKFNLNTVATTIAKYYETTKYAQKFANYVGSSNFLMDYR